MAIPQEVRAHGNDAFSKLLSLLQAEHNREVESLRLEIAALRLHVQSAAHGKVVLTEYAQQADIVCQHKCEPDTELATKHDSESACRPPFILNHDPWHLAEPAMRASPSIMPNLTGMPKLRGSEVLAQHLHVVTKPTKSFVFMPTNLASMLWSFFTAIMVLICVWADLLSLVDNFPSGHGPIGYAWEIFATCVFGIGIMIDFNTAVEDPELGIYVKDRRIIARRYLKTWFIVDLATTIPWGLIVEANGGKLARVGRMSKILKMMKAFRLIRLVKVIFNQRKSSWLIDVWDNWCSIVLVSDEGTSSMLYATRVVHGIVKVILLIFAESFILVCVLLANHDQSDLRWSHHEIDASALSVWRRYAVTTCWTMKSLATGSMDDEDILFTGSISSALTFKFVIGFVHAINAFLVLTIFFNIFGSDDSEFDYKLRYLKFYMRKHVDVSTRTRKKVLTFFRANRNVLKMKELHNMLEADLSPYLRNLIAFDTYYDCWQQFEVLYQFPFTKPAEYYELINLLCSIATTEVFHRGERVFSASQNPRCMYFLKTGNAIFASYFNESTEVRQSDISLQSLVDQLPDNGRIFYAVECIFSPAGTNMHPHDDLIATEISQFGKVTRKDLEERISSVDFPSEWHSFIRFLQSKVGSGEITASNLHCGVDNELVEEWQEMQKLDRSSTIIQEYIGVGCTYLLHHFKNDIQAEVGQCNFSETSFVDLGKHFWTDGVHRGFRGSAKNICPHDKLLGSSIVDALAENEKGRATIFVSWCWRYTVDILVSSLGIWTAAHHIETNTCSFWICFFCNNQRKVIIDNESSGLVTTFEERLRNIGRMVMVFDTIHNSLYQHRVWCIYESFTASKFDIQPEVAMPKSCQDDFHHQLIHGDLVVIRKSLTQIAVEQAEASISTDKEHIFNLIERSIGFAAVNECVKCALMSWLTMAFQQCLRTLVAASEPARILVKLIAADTCDPCTFSYNNWKVALEHHPGLLEFFDFEAGMLPEETFCLFHGSSTESSQIVTVQELESFLEQRQKNSLLALARWLRHCPDEDAALMSMYEDVSGRINKETQALKDQLREREGILLGNGRQSAWL